MDNKNIEKEIIPYKEAIKLELLGFNEMCFGFYNTAMMFIFFPQLDTKLIDKDNSILAPTFSQAFRWFRKNHNLSPIISNFGYGIENQYGRLISGISDDEFSMSYEEAELLCLKKMIEINK